MQNGDRSRSMYCGLSTSHVCSIQGHSTQCMCTVYVPEHYMDFHTHLKLEGYTGHVISHLVISQVTFPAVIAK